MGARACLFHRRDQPPAAGGHAPTPSLPHAAAPVVTHLHLCLAAGHVQLLGLVVPPAATRDRRIDLGVTCARHCRGCRIRHGRHHGRCLRVCPACTRECREPCFDKRHSSGPKSGSSAQARPAGPPGATPSRACAAQRARSARRSRHRQEHSGNIDLFVHRAGHPHRRIYFLTLLSRPARGVNGMGRLARCTSAMTSAVRCSSVASCGRQFERWKQDRTD